MRRKEGDMSRKMGIRGNGRKKGSWGEKDSETYLEGVGEGWG